MSPSRVLIFLPLMVFVSGLAAQELPRRSNVETVLAGEVHRLSPGGTAVLALRPGQGTLAAVDAGVAVAVRAHDDATPVVWGGSEGALLQRLPLRATASKQWRIDSFGTGPGWLRLEAPTAVRVELQEHHPARDVLANPWRRSILPAAAVQARSRPAEHDHVLPLGAGPHDIELSGETALRLVVYREDVSRQAPPDATWLRVEADGKRVFDAMMPTPTGASRPYIIEGMQTVLEAVGELVLPIPPGAGRLRLWGEPGLWLKVLAPLAGTPARHLDVAGEEGAAALDWADFDQAIAQWPMAEASVFLGRHSIFLPATLRPGAAILHTRLMKVRLLTREPQVRDTLNAPVPHQRPVGALLFHWLPPGGRWSVITEPLSRRTQLRLTVAHPADVTLGARLQLQRHQQPPLDLRLDETVLASLAQADSAADALLALQDDGTPVVDASQLIVGQWETGAPAWLENVGDQGLWVAVEERLPRPRALSMAALAPSLMPTDRLRGAVLGLGDMPQEGGTADPGTTRLLALLGGKLRARAEAFALRPCVQAGHQRPERLAQALARWADAEGRDATVARCAAEMAWSAGPGQAAARRAIEASATRAGDANVAVAALAWQLRIPAWRDDPLSWHQLAKALRDDGDIAGAWLVDLASGETAKNGDNTRDAELETLPAARAAGLARVLAAWGGQFAMAIGTAERPMVWHFDRPGLHRLELRNASRQAQWVRVRSGSREWMTWLPAGQGGDTALRDLSGEGPLGALVTVPFAVAGPGQVLAVESEAEIRARVLAPEGSIQPAPVGPERPLSVRVNQVQQGALHPLTASLRRQSPEAPAEHPDALGQAPVQPAADAPLTRMERGRASPENFSTTAVALSALHAFQQADPTRGLEGAVVVTDALGRGETLRITGLRSALQRHLTWRAETAVRASERRQHPQPEGLPSEPEMLARAQWAGVGQQASLVLRPGRRWVIDGFMPRQSVHLRLRQRGVFPTATTVRASGGAAWSLQGEQPQRIALRADASGSLRLAVDEALPGTFIEVDVLDERGRPVDGRGLRRWYRAPVTVEVSNPSLFLVQAWQGQTAQTSTVRVETPGSTQIGTGFPAGTWLRIHRLAARTEPLVASSPNVVRTAMSIQTPTHLDGAVEASPALTAPTAIEASDWETAGAEDGTWGGLVGWYQRSDADDAEDRRERFGEARWRGRWLWEEQRLWSRTDLVARRHTDTARVFGLEQAVEWQQRDGPWGASLDAALWQQQLPNGRARAISVRGELDWRRRRHERWHDNVTVGLRWRDFGGTRVAQTAGMAVDRDVYSRYRADHRQQLDLGYRLDWRDRFNSEWVAGVFALSNPFSTFGLDQTGGGLRWRYTNHGWQASAEWNVRRYHADARRARSFSNNRLELVAGKIFLGLGTGWRLRVSASHDFRLHGSFGGVSLEWFDHDGRGLADFAPSELFLRDVLEEGLYSPLIEEETSR